MADSHRGGSIKSSSPIEECELTVEIAVDTSSTTEIRILAPDICSKHFQRRRYSVVCGWPIGCYIVSQDALALTSGPELVSSLVSMVPRGELVEAVEIMAVGSRIRAFVHVWSASDGQKKGLQGWASLAANVGQKRKEFTWVQKVDDKAPSLLRDEPADDALNGADAIADPSNSRTADPSERPDAATDSLHTTASEWKAVERVLGSHALTNLHDIGSYTGLGLLPGLPGFSFGITGALRRLLLEDATSQAQPPQQSESTLAHSASAQHGSDA